jgi:uncharacterized membrane protein YjjP (DUF1212 family)
MQIIFTAIAAGWMCDLLVFSHILLLLYFFRVCCGICDITHIYKYII